MYFITETNSEEPIEYHGVVYQLLIEFFLIDIDIWFNEILLFFMKFICLWRGERSI